MKLSKQISFMIVVVGIVTIGVVLSGSPKTVITTQTILPKTDRFRMSGMVIPHHDIVKAERAEFFNEVKNKIDPPQTIILIGPNHYDSDRATIQTTSQTWNTTQGIIQPNNSVIRQLTTDGVGEESASFDNEHSIRLILSDIKATFPNTSIVPLILKTDSTASDIENLTTQLKKSCGDCFVVASVDFSHYQPALLANLHDDTTLRYLQTQDTESLIKNAEVDSPGTLAFFAAWAKQNETPRFNLWKHTNSGEIVKNPDIETTTHIFGYYETGESVTPKSQVSFTIGGDMMFDRLIAKVFVPKGYDTLFDNLGNRVFWGTDARIANLEGPISPDPVVDDVTPTNLVFNFPPESMDALKFLKLNGVSLANNHTQNAGTKGLTHTKNVLRANSIVPIGGPDGSATTEIGTFEGYGLKLVVIGYHALASTPDISAQIKQIKTNPNSRVLVFPHWGAEYAPKHAPSQAALAHQWIDAGADIVIGAHPHVVQDSELYKGKPIIYSVGNFVFDQTFSKETQQGLFVSGSFEEDGLKLFILPHETKNLKPQLMRGTQKSDIINSLYAPFKEFRQSTAAGDILIFPL